MGSGSDCGIPRIGCKCKTCKLARAGSKKDNRLRTSIALKKNNKYLIVDFGPDLRYQMIKYGIDFNNLEVGVITHAHNDHCIGLWERTAITIEQTNPLIIYSHPQILSYYFEQNSSFYYLRSSGVVVPKEVNFGQTFRTKNFSFHPFEISHTPAFLGPTLGYSFDKKKVICILETSKITEDVKKEINGSNTLIIDGTFFKENRFAHFPIKKSVDVLRNLDVKKVYYIGSNHSEPSHKEIQDFLNQYGFKMAYDGMKIKV